MDKTSKRIEDDQDLGAMYAQGSEITIWCEGRSHDHSTSEPPSKNKRKRKGTESENTPPTKRADMIDQLALELHEKHGEMYAMPHLRIWARMILNKQHKVRMFPHLSLCLKTTLPSTPQNATIYLMP